MYQQSIVSRRLKLGLVKMMYPPENGHYKRKLVSQPSVFRGYGTFLEGISWLVNPPNVPSSGIRVQEGLTKGNQMVNKPVIRPYLWGGVTLEGGWLTSHKSIFQMFFYSQQTYIWGAQKKTPELSCTPTWYLVGPLGCSGWMQKKHIFSRVALMPMPFHLGYFLGGLFDGSKKCSSNA